MTAPKEDVYKGELLQFPGPWAFRLPSAGIILVSDEQLEALQDPDAEVDLTLGTEPNITTLRRICDEASARGVRTLKVAFDHFWQQYRAGQGHEPRRLMPDTAEYIRRIAQISDFAQNYGIGLELSLLSPLELGVGYRRATGQSGRWLHYREGIRDLETGAFSVQLWQQLRWGNNKGTFELKPDGVRVFAFAEEGVEGTSFYVVRPESIREISACARVRTENGPRLEFGDFIARRVAVEGEGMKEIGPLDRVLAVLIYRTPEMDYFNPRAEGFLRDLLDKYNDAGVKLNGLYSDEMHIQQDWHYFSHHDHGQFALRYADKHLARAYSDGYGKEYADLDKYMVYFCSAQHDFLNTVEAAGPAQHVFGPSPEDVQNTHLFRARYYRMLEGGVVDLMTRAKRYAEGLSGHLLEARAHVTWAESPTIDRWEQGPLAQHSLKYEYTSQFLWSNTVHQAASACQDYFRWNDFLTGGGNDHAEGGYLDRDYFGLALACSTGIMNDVPYAYAAHWGMPAEISERRTALVDAYGASGSATFQAVQNSEHRDVDVLMLYPIDLVAVDERFGSWMVQYGYANYVSAEKLVAEGAATSDGRISMRGRSFGTLVALFEPFPSPELMGLLREFADAGGNLIWSGPPPLLSDDGSDARSWWEELFGARYDAVGATGLPVPGRIVRFAGSLAEVEPQTILTGLPVDHMYRLDPAVESETVARSGEWTVGTRRRTPGGGSCTALGFRPRDDQSKSLGDDVDTWFRILACTGAYPATGAFPDENDNTEYMSRTGPHLACRFPNGATAIAVHFRDYAEGWGGGFHRDAERDREWFDAHPLPSDRLKLQDTPVNGRRVTYDGTRAVAYVVDDAGDLSAFAGYDCSEITIDGRTWKFSDSPVRHIAWAPVPKEQLVPGGASYRLWVDGDGVVRVPLSDTPAELVAEGSAPGSRGQTVEFVGGDGEISVDASSVPAGCWLHAIPEPR